MKTWCKTACFIGTSVTIMLWTILRCRRLWKMATMMCWPPAPHPLYYHKQRRLIVRLCARHRRFMKKVARLWLHTTRLSSANIHKQDELPVAPLAASRTQSCDRTRANQTASCRLKRSERESVTAPGQWCCNYDHRAGTRLAPPAGCSPLTVSLTKLKAVRGRRRFDG